ncbi:MAG: zinc-dependent alcohol dehydrogenase, partial [Promethearchaeota archaeon]
MKQLVQTLKNGKIQIIEVPPPIINKGMIMVKNHYSLISPGTEGSTVRVARKSMVGKAKERPDQLKQVLEVLKRQGPIQTYRAVKQRLDAYSPLGYSCAGEVIDVSADIKGFGVGDMVACGGGGYANHAEIVAIPRSLSIKLPSNAELKRAAYNTLGAIALQGIRQADINIGETCIVIGLGLIGQLTCLILKAGGIKVIGVDIDSIKVDIAKKHCVDFGFGRNEAGLERKIEEFTNDIGADSIIITASSKSLDPINFAGRLARKKGKVVVVGDIPTGFSR